MAIKIKLKKLDLKISLNEFVKELLLRDFEFLPIKIEHSMNVSELDLIHRDPFDRMLISQSLIENLSIISRDEIFDNYGITRI